MSFISSQVPGSPPHVRGKVFQIDRFDCLAGITPACAGKSKPNTIQSRPDKDHPRMCGEKSIVRKASFDPQGSPPHVRGKELPSDRLYLTCRITPACAGKSFRLPVQDALLRDHPRMCGEKQDEPQFIADFLRITPACAGKSFMWTKCCQVIQDHPRMCGEKTKKIP